MKEQDYIRIMDRIRNDHIENAMLWDVSAQQQNRRSIRRLSLGVGAIAACIAVVIGCIGYSVHREHPANPSGETSGAENKEQLNLFGGHGEIKCTLGNGSSILYSDDEYYYFPTKIGAGQDTATVGGPSPDSFSYLRWEKEGGSVCEECTYEGILLSDGERLYTYHDGQLFITDSRGNETFFSGVPWKPCRIQKLGDDWYLLSAFLEDSWIDGNPQPYLFLDKPGEGIYQQYGNYGDVRSDGKGDTVYFRSENQIYSAPRKSPNQKTLLADAGDAPDAIADWTVDENNLYYITVSDGSVWYRMKPLDPDTQEQSWECMYPDLSGTDKQSLRDADDSELPTRLWNYYYFNDGQNQRLFTVTYTYRADVPEFQVYSTGSPIFPPGISSAMWYRYSVTAAELWGDHLPDPDVRLDMTFFDTDEHFIFTLPQEGMHGEQIVQLDKTSLEYRYLGVNYVQQETKPQETESQETEPADIKNDASDLNALGGRGKIRSFQDLYTNETGFAEDDEYIYDYYRGRRARKTGGDLVFEKMNLPQIPQYNPDSDQMPNLFITDGMVLLVHDSTLFEVHPDGTQTALSDLTADSAGDPLTDLTIFQLSGFAPDASGRPGKLFLNGTVQNHSLGGAILDLNTGTLVKLTTGENAPYNFEVTEDAVYAIDYYFSDAQNQYIGGLVRYDDDGKVVPVSTPEWGIPNLPEANIESNGTIWFRNQHDEPLKGNVEDHSVTTVSEDEFSRHLSNIPGTACDVWMDDAAHQLKFRNSEESGEQILKEFHNPEWEIAIRGFYVENGVIHIAVSAHESTSEKLVSLTVFTVDGSEVSSYEITAP